MQQRLQLCATRGQRRSYLSAFGNSTLGGIKRHIPDKRLPRLDGDTEEILRAWTIQQTDDSFVPKDVSTSRGSVPRAVVRAGVCNLMREHFKYLVRDYIRTNEKLKVLGDPLVVYANLDSL